MEINIRIPLFCNEIGQRENNEDTVYPKPLMATGSDRLFLVCDGMGGHEGGEIASEAVAQAISDYWIINSEQTDTAEKVMNAITEAVGKLDLVSADSTSNRKMGTTLTLLSVGAESVFVAHVGDSRIYQIRPGEGIIYRSKDHSLVQKWIDAGFLTEEEARNHPKKNVITQVIQPGDAEPIHPEVAILTDIQDGDYFFLCTDGVTETWEDAALADLLSASDNDEVKMDKIRSACLEHSKDNYSAYLIPLLVTKEETIDTDMNSLLTPEDLQNLHNLHVEQEADMILEQKEEKELLNNMQHLKVLYNKCIHQLDQLFKRKIK